MIFLCLYSKILFRFLEWQKLFSSDESSVSWVKTTNILDSSYEGVKFSTNLKSMEKNRNWRRLQRERNENTKKNEMYVCKMYVWGEKKKYK